MAGVVNVSTKKGSEDTGIDASINTGSFGTEKIQTGVGGPVLGKLFVLVFQISTVMVLARPPHFREH